MRLEIQVVAQELPDVFDRIEFGTLRRQRDESDVLRRDEAGRQMPTGLIEQKRGMSARRDLFCDFGKMQVHRLNVAGGQNKSSPTKITLIITICRTETGKTHRAA